MRKQLTKIALTATFGLALAFTLSCGEDNDDDKSNSSPSDGKSSSSDNDFVNESGTFTDVRDEQTYKWIKIDTQIWMAQNLNYKVEGSKCYGEDGLVYKMGNHTTLSSSEIQANCTKYGRLYDWATAMGISSSYNSSYYNPSANMKYQGVCPNGWHLPNSAEWLALTEAVGGSSTPGKYLKATSGWDNYQGASGNGTDNYGFSALPGGFGSNSDNGFLEFMSVGSAGIWWSTREMSPDSTSAYTCDMNSRNEYVLCAGDVKDYLYSVRCIKDSTP